MQRGRTYSRNIVEDLIEEEHAAWSSFGVMTATAESATGASLTAIAQGKIVSRVHAFFNELQPGKCCTRLKPQRRIEGIRLVQDQQKYPRSSHYLSMDLSATVLLDTDASLYKHVYACAHWPVLSSSDVSSPSPSTALSPFGEAGSRHEAVTAESLAKHMRSVFAFPVSSTAKVEKEVRSRPHAKALVEELVNQLAILEQNRHPFYLPSSFPTRGSYELWQKTQRRRIESLIAKFWHQPLPAPSLGSVDFPLKDRHEEYKNLVRRLLRYEAHCRRMEGTDDSSTSLVMFTASSRILREYALRYGIGDVYRHVALISVLAELFDCSLSFLSCTSLALGELLDAMPSNQHLMTRLENEQLREHLEAIRENCANFIVHMKDCFPENKPDGGVALLIRLTSQLRELDVLLSRKTESCSISDDLQACVKRGLHIIYEKHKAAVAERLGIAKAQRTLSPDLLYEMLIYITDEVSDYQVFHKEFFSYFNISHVAAFELYRFLMDDVVLLNEQASSQCDGNAVDVLMLGLAYRLSSLDKDWTDYIPRSEQRWRADFRRIHVPCWLTAVKRRLELFIQEACEADNFKTVDAYYRQLPVAKSHKSVHQITPSPSSPFTPYGSGDRSQAISSIRDVSAECASSPPLATVRHGNGFVPLPSVRIPGSIGSADVSAAKALRQGRRVSVLHPSMATPRADKHFACMGNLNPEAAASESNYRLSSAPAAVPENLNEEAGENVPYSPQGSSVSSETYGSKSLKEGAPMSSQLPIFLAPTLNLSDHSQHVHDNVAIGDHDLNDYAPSISADSSTPSSGRPSFGSLIMTHAFLNDTTNHDRSGLLGVPLLLLPVTGAAGPLLSSCVIDLIVVALRLEGFVRTVVEKICTPPSTVPNLSAACPCLQPGTAVADFTAHAAPPLGHSSSPSSAPVPASPVTVVEHVVVEQTGISGLSVKEEGGNVADKQKGPLIGPESVSGDGIYRLARQVLCDLFVLLSERLLCTDVDNVPEAVADKCIPAELLARLRTLEQFSGPSRVKTLVNEEVWLQQLEQKVNGKMCLRINNVLLLNHLLSYFYYRLFERSSSALADASSSSSSSSSIDDKKSEFVKTRCFDRLLAVRDAQVALLARQIYYVLVLPSRTAQILRQFEELAKLKEAAMEAKMRITVQCSFEASLKSVVAFLEHYLYPSLALEVLDRLWPLLREHFELQLVDLPLYGDCERKAVVLLMMLSCAIKLLTRSEGCASLSLEKLLVDCDPIIFRLDLYSISMIDLMSLYQELATLESRSSIDSSSCSEDQLAEASRTYLETMRKNLHSLKKCFSGEELLLYVIAHPPNPEIARARSWSGSSTLTMAPTMGRRDQHEDAQVLVPEQLTEGEALRICDYLLHTGTIVCVDVAGIAEDYDLATSDGRSPSSMRGADSTAKLDPADGESWETDQVGSPVDSNCTTPQQSVSPMSGSGASRRTASTSSLSSVVDPEQVLPKSTSSCDLVHSCNHPVDISSDNVLHLRQAGKSEMQQVITSDEDALLQPSTTDADKATSPIGACDHNHHLGINIGGSQRVKKDSVSSNPYSERSEGTESVSSLCIRSDYCFSSILAQYYVGRGRSNSNSESVREYVQRGLRTRRLVEQCAAYRVHASDVAAVLTARSRLSH